MIRGHPETSRQPDRYRWKQNVLGRGKYRQHRYVRRR